ncbi:hypothetical protein JCGZ_20213 [Jatropha curcas]|uniref:Uncharacterized protein n=1 Tax=Jatropha curcas TaxID=180498 RepID=A0A067K6F0_JATCU|nr:hypothetical protein JCGZ_20213 [Jatropha curcas]
MDLSVRGAHMKVGYRCVIEIWACEHRVLPMPTLFSFDTTTNERTLPQGRAWRFSLRYAHTTSDISAFRQMLNGLSWDRAAIGYQQWRLLLPGLFYDMYYIGERVYKWDLDSEMRRVPHNVPYYMLSTRSIKLKQDIGDASMGWTATDHLIAFVLSAYPIFVGFWSMHLHLLSLILLPRQMSLIGIRMVPQLGELAWHLWRAEVENSSMAGELIIELDASLLSLKRPRSPVATTQRRRLRMHLELAAPIHYFSCYFSLYLGPSWGNDILVQNHFREDTRAEEISVVPRLDINLTSMILPVFSFSAYEIPSYYFEADVMPLQPLINCALGMDRTSLYWSPVVCFCTLSQYLLLSDIDGISSLQLVPIVEQMTRRCTPFPLILAETFTWLGHHA